LLVGIAAAVCAHGQIPDPDLPALALAQAYFQANAAQYGLDDLRQQLRPLRSNHDPKGSVHIRFDQYFSGVRVFEGEAIAHVDASSQVSVTDAIAKQIRAVSTPTIPQAEARDLALAALNYPPESRVTRADLEIVPAGRVAQDTLAWHFQIFSRSPEVNAAQWDVFVDAVTGNAVWAFNSLETVSAAVLGNSMYSGEVQLNVNQTAGVYSLVDLARGGSETRDMRDRRVGNGTLVRSTGETIGDGSVANTDPDTAAVDAHYALAETWDYFLTTFGRKGIDGSGKAALNLVHYGNAYENAFWSDDCFCMTYGDGANTFYPLVALDVSGHEMAHGVMSTEANLTYNGESGGLNEANSDIFGTLVEFYANNPLTPPNYWIGERFVQANYAGGVYMAREALRYMDDPAKDGKSPACWYDGIRRLDVHYSSGPANHMFYLLSSSGPVQGKCNNTQVPGIGRDKAARIWYNAIVNYMTARTDYAGAKAACLDSAAALYGFGSAEYLAVGTAFSAIDVP
jgi:Zn-dependent metalloprotease